MDEEVIYYGVKMLIAYMLSGSVIGILFINMNCMQSVGKAFWADSAFYIAPGAASDSAAVYFEMRLEA